MKKLLLLLFLTANLVMADNLTDETLDLMLYCKGDGYFRHYGDKTYNTISSNETLHIKTNKYGRSELYFAESDWRCVTTTTEIMCYNQNKEEEDFEQKVKENPLMLRFGAMTINRLSGEAKIVVSYESSSADYNLVCKKKSDKPRNKQKVENLKSNFKEI